MLKHAQQVGTCIQEVSISNLNWSTGYCDFIQLFQVNAWLIP